MKRLLRNGMAAMAAVILSGILLSGCKTKEKVTDWHEMYIQETLQRNYLCDSLNHARLRIDSLSFRLHTADSMYRYSIRMDSVSVTERIMQRDSTSVERRGDTVFIGNWHWDYRSYEKHISQLEKDSTERSHEMTEIREQLSMTQDSLKYVSERYNELVSKTDSESDKTITQIKYKTPWYTKILAIAGVVALAALILTIVLKVRKGGTGK